MSDRQRIEKWIRGMERLVAEWDKPDIQKWRKAMKKDMPSKGEEDK